MAAATVGLAEGGEPVPWTLSLLGEDGVTVFQMLYDVTARRWRFSETHVCPARACTKHEEAGVTIWQHCEGCRRALAYFGRWMAVALLMMAGEFAASEEPVMREVREEICYKEQRAGSGKYEEKRLRVGWRVVTFDVSVQRRKAAGRIEEEAPHAQKEAKGPSWLEVAVEKGTVVYVHRRFGKSTRRLDPARNTRWKYAREVPVKAYQKRVPMSVERLSKLIVRVVASTEEKGQENGK